MGSIFNHMNKKDKIIIDVNSNYDKVRLVLTAKVVREGGVAIAYLRCPGGGIGRHKGFKIPRRSRCAGSSPDLSSQLNAGFFVPEIQINLSSESFLLSISCSLCRFPAQVKCQESPVLMSCA